MAIDRRHFLVGSLLALTHVGSSAKALAASAGAEFISAARLADGSFAVVLLSAGGQILREIPLTARGHDIALDLARRRGVVFARRPGYFALAFDLDGTKSPQVFAPEDGRHFYGHGAFSGDGRLLFTSENDIDSGNGVIGIYETGTWRRRGELPSYGIGPHEAVLLADGRTLAIANGGFATEPSSGREPIDLSSMEPSLAFVDVETGELKAKHKLPAAIHLLSIRHLAAHPTGEVWFGAQWQGGLESSPELVGVASQDREIRILENAAPQGVALKGYIGSVALSADGSVLAASAPRAGRIVFLETASGKLLRTATLEDGCGIAPTGGAAFALTSGHGVLRRDGGSGLEASETRLEGLEFDNHLRFVPGHV